VKTLTYNGCTYEYRYCYAEIDGYHCIALSDIVVLAPCSYLDFENNASDIVDNMLIAIATDPYIIAWTGHTGVPDCPDGECLQKIYDAICYNGWTIYTRYTVTWQMNKCDDLIRSCNETVYVCWDSVNNRYQVIRRGFEIGPPCEYPCSSTCDF